jgi:hypothetical protein
MNENEQHFGVKRASNLSEVEDESDQTGDIERKRSSVTTLKSLVSTDRSVEVLMNENEQHVGVKRGSNLSAVEEESDQTGDMKRRRSSATTLKSLVSTDRSVEGFRNHIRVKPGTNWQLIEQKRQEFEVWLANGKCDFAGISLSRFLIRYGFKQASQWSRYWATFFGHGYWSFVCNRLLEEKIRFDEELDDFIGQAIMLDNEIFLENQEARRRENDKNIFDKFLEYESERIEYDTDRFDRFLEEEDEVKFDEAFQNWLENERCMYDSNREYEGPPEDDESEERTQVG